MDHQRRPKSIELSSNPIEKSPPHERRHGISKLKLLIATIPAHHKVVWKGHETLDLGHAKPSTLPVERADPGTWLALNGRRRTIGVKLQ